MNSKLIQWSDEYYLGQHYSIMIKVFFQLVELDS